MEAVFPVLRAGERELGSSAEHALVNDSSTRAAFPQTVLDTGGCVPAFQRLLITYFLFKAVSNHWCCFRFLLIGTDPANFSGLLS